MTQNINLLEELEVRPVSPLNSKLIVQISVAWALILSLIYILATGIDTGKKKDLLKLEKTRNELVTKIANLGETATPAAPAKNTSLEETSTSSTNILGFYNQLEDLAKFIPDGVWLNEIIISEPGDNVTLTGSSIIPLGASSLIQALERSKNFTGKKFRKLHLEKNAKSGLSDFTISTISLETNSAPQENNKKTKNKKK